MNKKTKFVMSVFLLAAIAACGDQMASVSNGNVRAGDAPHKIIAPSPTPRPTPEPVVQINKDPAKLASAFYEFYLDGLPAMKGNEVVFARFLTTRFYNEALRADDIDVFLDAQDFDDTWNKNSFSTSSPVISGNKATVEIRLKGETFKWVLKVSLIKKAGTWKIDRVKNLG